MWSPTQTRSQFAAIAWLRWRMLLNGFRRKGGAGELIARIILYPILAGMAIAPTIGAGAAAWYFASNAQLEHISWLLWITFGLCQLLNINLGQPGTTFDPTQLIRFPLAVSGYTAIRLFFGILTPANIIGTLMSLSIALGITIAIPTLFVPAFVALSLFAATNVLFSRMVFAWVDRWLSTRRAREVFTGLVFVVSLGIQWLNVTYNVGRHHADSATSDPTAPDPTAKFTAAAHLYQRVHPFLHVLPPELTASSLVAVHTGRALAFLALNLACALFALAFLAIFTLRMRTEFRGESLSDAANAVPSPKKSATLSAKTGAVILGGGNRGLTRVPESQHPEEASTASTARTLPRPSSSTPFTLPPVFAAVLGKELLTLRRNMGLFYAVVAPIVFVFLFAGRLASRSGNAAWIFPAAVAYTLLGITPLSFNSFGLEGAGSQFYFLAPIRFRDVFLAKNLINFLLALAEIVAVFAIVTYVAAMPPLQSVAIALLWAAATLLFATSVGNRRSLSAPKKINLQRAARRQASGLSALIGMGIFLLSAIFASTLFGLAMFFHFQWVLIPVFTLYFAAALAVYLYSLGTLDRFALNHREQLFLELCKPD